MSAPNFKTMENFPLFVLDMDRTDEYGDPVMDWWEVEDLCKSIREELSDLNDDYMFHKITLESGYYSGVQFYVDELNYMDELTNEDCRYEFDLYRSQALRRYQSEINKINRALRKLAAGFGFEEYYCAGVFSNGAALYYKVQNTVRSRIHRAATETQADVRQVFVQV